MNNGKKLPIVRRISVDERITEDLILLEICELRTERLGDSGEIIDEPKFWKDIEAEEEENWASPIKLEKETSIGTYYVDLMSIPKSLVESFLWKDFEEGQVFLSGEFEVKKGKEGEIIRKRYFVRPGAEAFVRIDEDVKESTKVLYYSVLAKGEKNAK